MAGALNHTSILKQNPGTVFADYNIFIMYLHSPFLCSRKKPELGYSLNQSIYSLSISLWQPLPPSPKSFSLNDKIALTPYMVIPKNICSFNFYRNSGKAVLVARTSTRGGGAPLYIINISIM